MIDITAIKASMASAGNPREALSDLDEEELRDLLDEVESEVMREAIMVELAERADGSGLSFGLGSLLWLIILAAVAGSIVLALT